MKLLAPIIENKRTRATALQGSILIILLILGSGCSSLDPRRVDVELPRGKPEVNATIFTQALHNFGRMTEIYGESVRVEVENIADATGTGQFTKAEIPMDITEITKSTINTIGGNVIFIPYNPNFMLTQREIGYTNFDNKFIPDVVLSGGITEFDRGLVTVEDRANLGYQTTHFGEESPTGLEYQSGSKGGSAKISVDFNLIDFQTMSGIPRMQTSNSILVHKGIGEKELALTLFGPTLGLRGKIKKVEGRHGAIRLLVQASILQILGRYMDLPYWRLLPGHSPDPVVVGYVEDGWRYQMDNKKRVAKIQELLYLHGYTEVAISGQLDQATRAAMQDFARKQHIPNRLDSQFYSVLYFTVPLDQDTLDRRYALLQKMRQQQTAPAPPMTQHTQPTPEALDQLFEKLQKKD